MAEAWQKTRWMKANPEPETEATIASVADKADPARKTDQAMA